MGALVSSGLVAKIGGNFTGKPEELYQILSLEERAQISSAFEGIDVTRMIDVHTHVCGVGTDNSGCMVHDHMQQTWYNQLFHPYHYTKLRIFASACGVTIGDAHMDQAFVDRLSSLVTAFAPPDVKGNHKHMLLAFDNSYTEDGKASPPMTGMYIPNDWVDNIVSRYPDKFEMACSVHPYRPDAAQELEKWAKKGVRLVKWLPNSQHIDPEHKLCHAFYQRMRELKMALLTHTGHEHSVDAGGVNNDYGHPYKLRAPLDAGVVVVAAHCASEGDAVDFEVDGNPSVPAYQILLKLMDEEKYRDLLYADLSAIIGFKRVQCLEELLNRSDLHNQFIYGSDYPVPCVNVVVHTNKLVKLKLLTSEQRLLLNKVYGYNPCLFDFLAKRWLKSSTGNQFALSVYTKPAFLSASPAAATASDIPTQDQDQDQD